MLQLHHQMTTNHVHELCSMYEFALRQFHKYSSRNVRNLDCNVNGHLLRAPSRLV